MLTRNFSTAFVLTAAAFLVACEPKFDCRKTPSIPECQYEEPAVIAQKYNNEGRLYISTFNEDAYEQFDLLRKFYDKQLGTEDELDRQHLCDAEYGKLIASFQDVFRRINVMVGDVGATLINDLGGSAFGAGPGYSPALSALGAARDFLPARQDIIGDKPQDLGDSISLGLDNIGDPLERMVTAATEIEQMPDCEFVMGPESLGESVSEDQIKAEQGYYNFVPLRLLANQELRATTLPIALELRLGDRWDGVEARALGSVANLVTAMFHFVSAHKIEMRTDIYQIANAVGLDLSGVVACFSERGAWYGLPAGDFDTDDNGYLSTTEECTAYYASFDLYLPDLARKLVFLFADNPGFFAQHETRWTEYFPDVDNRMATATTELDGMFDAMAARVNVHPTDVEQERFFVYYKDSNEDGRVGIQDKVGIKLQGLKLKLPEKWVTEIGFGSVEELEDIIMQFADILIVSMPSDSIVDDARLVLRKASDSYRAVDDPNVEYSYIRLRDVQGLLYTSGLFTEVPPPDVLGLDLGAYFRSPKALRDFMPYWEVVQDSETPRNEWIVETEAVMSTYVNSGRAVNGQVRPWERVGDSDHFRYQYEATDSTVAELLGCGSTQYIGMYADLNPNIVPDAYYCSASIASDVPRDCLGPTLATADSPLEYIMYIYFRDPSFNGMVLTDTSTLDANETQYEDISGRCYSEDLNGAGLIPATNYTFHRAMVAFTVWILNENKFASLLSALGG